MIPALVICGNDPARDPRPNRMIRCLSREYAVTVLSRGSIGIPGVTEYRIPPYPSMRFTRKLLGVIAQRLGRRKPGVWPPGLVHIAKQLRSKHFPFISVHTLELLPVGLTIAGQSSRLLFDAREYYPRQGEDRWWWRTMYQPVAASLCKRYLHRASIVLAVSPGLAQEYKREFGVTCHLFPSLPSPSPLVPKPVDPQHIRMIYHGNAATGRKIERMIEIMRLLPSNFSLDLMLMGNDRAYIRKLHELARGMRSVVFRPPVSFAELVTVTNGYDIGLYVLAPTSFNTLHALPNKFFEFVQARLMIAVGPSPDMADYVHRYGLGIVAEDFTAESMARRLRALTTTDIMAFKANAHAAARVLSSDRTDEIACALARGVPPPSPP